MRQRQPRGMAALATVLVLLGLAATALAYAQRGLVVELRAAAQSARQAQAHEAAEAGLQWAQALLNEGGTDAACRPSSDTSAGRWRDRHWTLDRDGRYQARAHTLPDADGRPALVAACALDAGGWRCACPADGTAAVAATAGDTTRAVFTVEVDPQTAPPGVVGLVVHGCVDATGRCDGSDAAAAARAHARLQARFAALPALASLPVAALTARRAVALNAPASFTIVAGTSTAAAAVHAGGSIDASGATLVAPPGTPPSTTLAAGDAALAELDATTYVARLLGLPSASFATLPGLQTVDCSGECTAALARALARGTRLVRVLGDLDLLDGSVGSVDEPVLLAVQGRLRLHDGARLTGLVLAETIEAAASPAAVASVRGAAVTSGACCSGAGSARLVHDAAVLARLQRAASAFVRVPASWSDVR